MQRDSQPFDSIESARDYVRLLCEALDEAARMIHSDLESPSGSVHARHLDALRLVDYKLRSLRQHLVSSRLLLNDLRTLRRYLLDERTTDRISGRDATDVDPKALPDAS